MKKLLVLSILTAFVCPMTAMAESKATTNVYSNKYLNVSVEHPTVDTKKQAIPETETEKNIKETKKSLDATKQNIKDIKKIWGMK